MKLPSKVYAIQHLITKKTYIGRSAEPENRYLSHLYALRRGAHPVEDLQADFNKYGEHLAFTILDNIQNFDEREKEFQWMEKLRTYDRRYGYNYKDHGAERFKSTTN